MTHRTAHRLPGAAKHPARAGQGRHPRWRRCAGRWTPRAI